MLKTKQNKACFITFEGIDGAGKSTHVEWLHNYLKNKSISSIKTREPGGTNLSESLRQILLNTSMHISTEALLMFAARNEHLHQLIRPALENSTWVICDRFTDASYAYQVGGRGLEEEKISVLEQWVHADLQPDITFLFDLPLDVARSRLQKGKTLDRFEHEENSFFERTRNMYLQRAKKYSSRFCAIDSTQTIEEIRIQIQNKVDELIRRLT